MLSEDSTGATCEGEATRSEVGPLGDTCSTDRDEELERFLLAMSAVMGSLGRAFLCLDREMRVVHASTGLDDLLDQGAAQATRGLHASELLGEGLFGPDGSLVGPLQADQRREGWGATLQLGDGTSRMVSITAAPLAGADPDVCDPRVAYVVIIRPEEEETEDGTARPSMFAGMVARSARMLNIFRLIGKLSESDATVLVQGESGTGKELVARAVHTHSSRGHGPFVAVNCGALPGDLLESELFGHVRGAFTGAVRDRAGRFEAAGDGSLFLDEVGELPLSLQVKLLRVLQDGTYQRVGESTNRHAECRIIAATNRDLKEAVRTGDFRDDLYYRLRVVPITVPPLRERREDIEPLAHHLLARACRRHGRALRMAPSAMRALLIYSWPGNVRELENALEYGVAVAAGQTIHARDLPAEITDGAAPLPTTDAASTHAPPAAVENAGGGTELRQSAVGGQGRDAMLAVLESHRWNRQAAAAALGMSRTTLWRRMRELGLSKQDVSI